MEITYNEYTEAAKNLAKLLRKNKVPSVINKITYNMNYIDNKANVRVYTRIKQININEFLYIDFEYEDAEKIENILKENDIPFISKEYQAIKVPVTSFM